MTEEFTPLAKRNQSLGLKAKAFFFFAKKCACRISREAKWMVFVGIGEKSGWNEKDFSKIQGVKPLQMRNATVIMKK
ncbi:hypothetical protein [Anaerotignum faecicola]